MVHLVACVDVFLSGIVSRKKLPPGSTLQWLVRNLIN